MHLFARMHELMAVSRSQTSNPCFLVQELSDRLKEESSRTAEAITAADTARQQQHLLQAELAASQTTARMVPGLQVGSALGYSC
jgi:hypothetical protein